jgi:glutathione synthase/RimK-type ligase-like ATP-grasp enzyme
MPKIGFITSAPLRDLTPDDRIAADALRQHGIEVEGFVWDDPAANPADYDALIFRSTWDYFTKSEQFTAWLEVLEASGVPVYNPVSVVRWNSDKRYLPDLAERGVEIIPTVYLERGQTTNLQTLMQEQGWQNVVVKPTISAGAYQTWLTSADQAAKEQSQLDAMLKEGTVMLQPYLPEVETSGEWSLIFFNGRFSHAVVKIPVPGDFRSQPKFGSKITSTQPSEALLQQAQAVLEAVDEPVLYARVDGLLRDEQFYLMEIELIEPHLFFESDGGAAERFADAVLELLA